LIYLQAHSWTFLLPLPLSLSLSLSSKNLPLKIISCFYSATEKNKWSKYFFFFEFKSKFKSE
jgi:hypothetical protein